MLRLRSDLHNNLYDAFRGSRIRFARATPPAEPADPQIELASA